jgi:hypothetical protein
VIFDEIASRNKPNFDFIIFFNPLAYLMLVFSIVVNHGSSVATEVLGPAMAGADPSGKDAPSALGGTDNPLQQQALE